MFEHPRDHVYASFVRLVRIETEPMGKPRMTQRDKWNKRPIVKRWNTYKDVIRILSPPNFVLPYSHWWMVFTFKIPGSGMENVNLIGEGHMKTPDKDNLEKGITDIFLPGDDSKVFDGRSTKLWGDKDSIEIWWNQDGLGTR